VTAEQASQGAEVTLWESVTNPQGRRLLTDWNAILDLPEWVTPPERKNKMLGRGWSPATFAGDRRLKDRVERVCALVLDYEAQGDQAPTSLDDAAALWGRWHGWIHTTHSHTPDVPRFRVVLPLSRSVTPEEFRLVWRWAAVRCLEVGHAIDEACRDASRLWLLPVVRPGALAEYRLQPLGGEAGWLDVETVLQEQRRAEAPPPPPPPRARRETTGDDGAARYVRKALEGALDDIRRAPKGTRHNTIRSRAYHLGGLIHTGAITADEIERELMAEAQRCGWDNLDKTRATVRYQIEAGRRAPQAIPELRTVYRQGAPDPGPAPSGEAAVPDDGEDHPAPPEEDWTTVLIRRKGEITSDLANVVAYLEHDPYWRGRLRYNEARQQIEVQAEGDAWRTWQDHDDTDGAVWFQRARGLRVRPEAVCQAVQSVSRRHAVNPLTDYLGALVWDGVPRLEAWLVRYAAAQDSAYVRAAGACWLRSAVARAFVPGIKVDAALVLEGAQGAGKSTVFAVLGGEYFTDDIHDLGSKDAAVAMASAWIVELPELSALGRTDLETLKAACSRQVDRYRPPYGRALVAQPRRCVFGGTTNRAEYLRDETGNRRWLPVKVGAVDLAALRADRDQLLAEAVASWRAGLPLALPREVWGEAAEEQAARVESDPWEDQIAATLRGEKEITVVRVLTAGLGLELAKVGQREQNRVARCLTRLGWERFQRRDPGGGRTWAYRPVSPVTSREG
jgi:predicted P-loop ATPase